MHWLLVFAFVVDWKLQGSYCIWCLHVKSVCDLLDSVSFILYDHRYHKWIFDPYENIFSLIFSKLLDKTSDLHEILYGCQILTCGIKFQISWRFVHKHAPPSCKCTCAHFIASTWICDSCVRICAWTYMKF